MIEAEKGVSCPVHGTISLSKIEARVISTRAFQRLRNIRQLGLAHMVFPSADYSRFSHSLGTCHVTRRIIEALRSSGVNLSAEEEQKFRLAGLLHDVGHYPFSHAMEDAVHDYYSGRMTQDAPAVAGEAPLDLDKEKWLRHEAVGKEILKADPEISEILDDGGIEPEAISQIFTRGMPLRFSNLISSDLDADRIDYLLRTAHHTGLPHGAVDLEYLLNQLCVDGEENICIKPKALRTADHFLLGRYFDYHQVAFNKTVAGLEWVLKDVLKALLDEKSLSCSELDVKARISAGTWEAFDDAGVLRMIRDLHKSSPDPIVKAKTASILFRTPPRLVAQAERLAIRKDGKKELSVQKQLVQTRLKQWVADFGIPLDLWHVRERALPFTKVGTSVPISAVLAGDLDGDSAEQAIRVRNRDGKTSQPIMNISNSLMSVLSDQALFSLRIYVILSPEEEKKRQAIEERIRTDVVDIDWF